MSALMKRITAELQDSLRFVNASDVIISMLIRIIKTSSVAYQWVRNNRSNLRWLENWLNARKSGTYPSGSVLSKPRRGGVAVTGGAGNGNNAQQGAASATGAQVVLAGTRVAGGGLGIQAIHLLLRRCLAGEPMGETYDSDDEPQTLVGRRIKVIDQGWSCNSRVYGLFSCILLDTNVL